MNAKLSVFVLSLLSVLLAPVLLVAGATKPGEQTEEVLAAPVQTYTFSGHVYLGQKPDIGSPLSDVTVTLFGSNDANTWNDMLDTGSTDANGAYTLSGSYQVYEYYHIVETDPPYYHSTGAQAGMEGMVVNRNWIRYDNPSSGTHIGNRFWDQAPATATPTPTPPPHPPHTPTVIPTGTVEPRADLEIDTVDFPDPVAPGAPITYTLVITNHGWSIAPNVVVSDVLPAEVSYVSDTENCDSVGNRPPNDVLRCGLGDMGPGASNSFQIVARVDDDACGPIRNRAEVWSESNVPDPIHWNNWASPQTLVAPCEGAAVLVHKRRIDPPGRAQLGDIFTFEIEIINIGTTDLTAVSLADTYNSHLLEFSGASREPTQVMVGSTEGVVTWADLTAPSPYGFGSVLPPGDSFVVHVRFRAIGVGGDLNCAEVSAQGEGGEAKDRGCSYAEIIDPSTDLQLSKTLDDPSAGPARVGQSVRFFIRVANTGTEPITELRLHDGYDTDYLYFQHTFYEPDDPTDDGSLDWSDLTQPSPHGFNGPLLPGHARSFSINFGADSATPPGQPTENCVWALYTVGDVPDQETPEHCVPLVIVSEPEPGLEVDKILYEPPGGVAQPGDLVKFRFKITNTGATEFTNVALDDFYDTDCLRFVPTGAGVVDPDDPADDGHLDWSHWLGLTSLGPGMSVEAIPGAQFQAKAGSGCDPTSNHLEGVATDQNGHQVSDTDDEPVRIIIQPMPTDTPTPTATSTPTHTPTPTVTPVGYRIYLPLIVRN